MLSHFNTITYYCLFVFVIKNAKDKYPHAQILCLAVKAARYTKAPLFGGISGRQYFIVKLYFYENRLGNIHHFEIVFTVILMLIEFFL